MSTASMNASDDSEFGAFVAASSDRLLRTAYLLSWDLSDAEDLVQECLAKVARRWRRVRRMDHPYAFARQVLVNLVRDERHGRARRRSEIAAFDDVRARALPDDASLHAMEEVSGRADVLAMLGELPPRQRATLVLRYFDDLTEAQTATALGCSVGTVKSTTAKALARLREQLENDADPTPNALRSNA